MKQEKIKMFSVEDTRRLFYDALETKDVDTMADYFETLYSHYTSRGRLLRQKNRKLKMKKIVI